MEKLYNFYERNNAFFLSKKVFRWTTRRIIREIRSKFLDQTFILQNRGLQIFFMHYQTLKQMLWTLHLFDIKKTKKSIHNWPSGNESLIQWKKVVKVTSKSHLSDPPWLVQRGRLQKNCRERERQGLQQISAPFFSKKKLRLIFSHDREKKFTYMPQLIHQNFLQKFAKIAESAGFCYEFAQIWRLRLRSATTPTRAKKRQVSYCSGATTSLFRPRRHIRTNPLFQF